MSAPDRRAMLDRADRALSLRRQCALVGVARSGVYRPRKPANDNDVALTRRIDELFTAWPFLGSRRMTAMLRAEGVFVNRKRVQRLMRLMGIAALGPKPRTTKAAPGHRIYPYLLRNLTIERANHVWAADHQCAAASGVRDGGWSPAIGLQERVANHRKRRWSKARVVSVTEKALQRRQVGDRKANTSEPPFKCRKRSDDVETGE